MSKKKPPSAFEVVFEGPGIYPEKIPIGKLARALSAVQRLASGQEQEEEDAVESQEDRIRLLGVRRGSAAYQFSAPQPHIAISHLRDAGKVLDDPESLGENEYVLSPVEELSNVAKSLECMIVMRAPGKDGVVLARIGPRSFSAVSEKLFIHGETAIIGRVERVGGADRTEMRPSYSIPITHAYLSCRER